MIDVGFLRELRARRIHVRPALTRLTTGHAVFADETEEPFDAVVAATGFTTGLEQLLADPSVLDEQGLPREMHPEDAPGLYFMGYVETVRGQLFEANREAKRLAERVEVYLRRETSSA